MRAAGLWVFLLCAFSCPAMTQAAEARAFRLTDGRMIAGVVVESTAEAMVVRTAQGLRAVPYAGIVGIENITEDEVWNQPPLVLLAAPTTGPGRERVDSMLSTAAQLMPKSRVVDVSGQWADLVECRGAVECIRPLVLGWGAGVLWVPTIDKGGSTLNLSAWYPTTGARLGVVDVSLTEDDSTVGPRVVAALFSSLGIQPEFDIGPVAAALFPPPAAPPAVVEAPPTVSPTSEAARVPATASSGAPVAEAEAVGAPAPGAPAGGSDPCTAPGPAPATPVPAPAPVRATAAASPRGGFQLALDQRRAHALAFLPVPGLVPALLRDPGAFVLAAAGGVGTAWVGVYGVGRQARSAGAFWGSSIALSYVSNLAFQQIATAIAWKNRERR